MATKFPVLGQEQLKQRMEREGTPWIVGANAVYTWNSSQAAGGMGVGGPGSQSLVKALYYDNIVVTSSKQGTYQILGPFIQDTSGIPIGNTIVTSASFVCGPSSPVTIPMNMLISQQHQTPSLSILSIHDQDPNVINAQVSGGGVALKVGKNGSIASGGIIYGNNTNLGNGTFSYTLDVVNNSGSSSTGTITVTDTLPADVNYISSSGTGWTVTVASGVLTATSSTSIANGSTSSITIILSPKSNVNASCFAFGYQVDFDVAYEAPPAIWCGTSITAGASPSNYQNHYTYLIRNWMRDVRGVSTRIINKGIAGSSSVPQENLRAFNNRYDIADLPFIAFYEEGINDSAQGVPNATTIANMQAYVAHWRRRSAKIWIFVLAPFPTGNSTYEALNQTLHNAMGPAVAALGDPYVTYVSETRTCWNAVTENTLCTTDNIHPNDTGNLRIYNAVTTHILNGGSPLF